MSEHSYHDDFDSVSKTMLAHFHESPHDYWRYYVAQVERPPQPKSALVGAIAHDVLLTDSLLSDVACVYPGNCLKSNGAINPKPAREWEASLKPGQYAVKQVVHDQIDSLLSAISGHEMVKLLERADFRETPIYWQDGSGVNCRCRPDFLLLDDDVAVCHDPKFTSSVQPWKFWRTAQAFRYWMQDALYSAGVSEVHKVPCQFVFWAVEDTMPHRIARYEYTPDSRKAAAEEVAATLAELAARRAGGCWTDEWAGKVNPLFYEPNVPVEDTLDWGDGEKENQF